MSPVMFWECMIVIFSATLIATRSQPTEDTSAEQQPLTSPSTTPPTKPPDVTNCDLSSTSPFSYMVKIWDTVCKNTTAHGALISTNAVLTSVTNFDESDGDNYTAYNIIAQNIWNPKQWDDPCEQVRTIKGSVPYDKCCKPDSYKFYNFMVFITDKPFQVSSSFSIGNRSISLDPLLPIPQDPASALLAIMAYNLGAGPECNLPLFKNITEHKPALLTEKEQKVKVLNYNQTCITQICEKAYFRDGGNAATQQDCETYYQKRKYGTMMCVEFVDKTIKSQLSDDITTATEFYAGAPLLCGGVALGLVTEVFMREDHRPFFLVASYLRVYEWLLRLQALFTNRNGSLVYVEKWGLVPQYRSSEPVPAYFVDPAQAKPRYVRSLSSKRELSLVLVLLTAVRTSYILRFSFSE